MKRADIKATPKFKKIMEKYASEGALYNPQKAQVVDPAEAKSIAATSTGQSYSEKQKDRVNADRYGVSKK